MPASYEGAQTFRLQTPRAGSNVSDGDTLRKVRGNLITDRQGYDIIPKRAKHRRTALTHSTAPDEALSDKR
jgi:hypothetical protein